MIIFIYFFYLISFLALAVYYISFVNLYLFFAFDRYHFSTIHYFFTLNLFYHNRPKWRYNIEIRTQII